MLVTVGAPFPFACEHQTGWCAGWARTEFVARNRKPATGSREADPSIAKTTTPESRDPGAMRIAGEMSERATRAL